MTTLYQYDDMAALSTLSLTRAHLAENLQANEEKIEAFAESLKGGMFPGFTVAHDKDDLAGLTMLASNWSGHFKHIVYLGVGGSALGAKTLVSFLGEYKKHDIQPYFLDNVDPFTVDHLLNTLPLEETIVITTSKSGGTLETLSQTLLFAKAFQDKNLPLAGHILGITEDKESPLKNFLTEYEIPTLNHSKEVGGRFTVLTLVGMLPAIVAGVDAAAIREGAVEVLDAFYKNPTQSEPAYGAAFAVKSGEIGKPVQYMMPYSDRLNFLSDWFVQLWGESLGKEGTGTTPVPALGSTDQHSALQMLMEGPKDKTVSIILPNCLEEGTKIDPEYAEFVEQPFMSNLNLGKILYNQAHGTADALNDNGVPVRMFYAEPLNEKVLGALLMHFMLETAIGGILWDVNTWDQPGVEEGKKRTMGYLSKGTNN